MANHQPPRPVPTKHLRPGAELDAGERRNLRLFLASAAALLAGVGVVRLTHTDEVQKDEGPEIEQVCSEPPVPLYSPDPVLNPVLVQQYITEQQHAIDCGR